MSAALVIATWIGPTALPGLMSQLLVVLWEQIFLTMKLPVLATWMPLSAPVQVLPSMRLFPMEPFASPARMFAVTGPPPKPFSMQVFPRTVQFVVIWMPAPRFWDRLQSTTVHPVFAKIPSPPLLYDVHPMIVP